jgi:hypothetical protein
MSDSKIYEEINIAAQAKAKNEWLKTKQEALAHDLYYLGKAQPQTEKAIKYIEEQMKKASQSLQQAMTSDAVGLKAWYAKNKGKSENFAYPQGISDYNYSWPGSMFQTYPVKHEQIAQDEYGKHVPGCSHKWLRKTATEIEHHDSPTRTTISIYAVRDDGTEWRVSEDFDQSYLSPEGVVSAKTSIVKLLLDKLDRYLDVATKTTPMPGGWEGEPFKHCTVHAPNVPANPPMQFYGGSAMKIPFQYISAPWGEQKATSPGKKHKKHHAEDDSVGF